jgi:hypothetical protein
MHCTRSVLDNVGSLLYRSFFLGLMILCIGRTTSVNSGNQLSCVWCRARWVVPGNGAASNAAAVGARGQEGYLNLGAVAGISPVRDTSTCQYPLPFVVQYLIFTIYQITMAHVVDRGITGLRSTMTTSDGRMQRSFDDLEVCGLFHEILSPGLIFRFQNLFLYRFFFAT